MGKTYDKFLRAGLDLAPLGVWAGGEAYFCTPRGAEIIGSEGVDGVHYCFAPGYGETVFAVSPGNAAPERVHAVARDFADFLRLLLACGHGAAIEQCWAMTRASFVEYLAENPVTEPQRAAMERISSAFALEPMPDPWGYIHGLQAGFDYGGIKYTDPEPEAEAEETAEPEWAVYYGPREGAPGRELRLMRDFRAFGERWTALALYFCEEGLVLHLAREVEPMAFRAFMERSGLSFTDAGREFSAAERMRIEAENPLSLDFDSALIFNGERVESSGGSGCGWISLPGAKNPSRGYISHYGLDADYCWSFRALRYPLRGAAPEPLRSLELELRPDCVELPGRAFTAREGESVELRHPFTGEEYTLTVLSAAPETVSSPDCQDCEFPGECLKMSYAVEPDAPGLSLRDANEGDRARSKDGSCCAAVTAVIASDGDGLDTASSLYFELPESIEWLPVWRVERGGPVTVKLK